MDCCCLCGESGDANIDLIVLTDKGRKTLVSASIERCDGKAELLESLSPPKVHSECRKNYTRQSSIQKQKRSNENPESGGPSNKQPKLRSEETPFDFKSDCLFCGEIASQESKQSKDRRKTTHEVETLEFIESLKSRCKERNDSWGETVLSRIEHVYDLVATEARYHSSCRTHFFLSKSTPRSRGRPVDNETAHAFDSLCKYMEESEECQFSFNELLGHMHETMGGKCTYTTKYLKKKLESEFGDRVTITSLKGRTNIVMFKDSADKILQESWYANRNSDPASERMRIVQKAASIIREDIRSRIYACDEYPLSDEVLNSAELIPPTLDTFLQTVIYSGRQKKQDIAIRRCSAIAQSIVSACRPRSFISPVLLSIAVYIHRKYASKELIDILHSLMFSCSYREVQQYISSIMLTEDSGHHLERFVQFVFDNADSNIRTLDGHNTFHSMGGIACVSPSGPVTEKIISRVKDVTSVGNGSFGFIPVVQYQPSRAKQGLAKIEIRALDQLCKSPQRIRHPPLVDSLFLVASVLGKVPSWSGFMQLCYHSQQSDRSRIEILPFINLNPSDLSTIYTALKFVQTECEKHDLNMSPVTFDQPLYIKAVDIVASSDDLSNLFVRLGGFHLLMSFMGSIGALMAGSGIEDLWGTIYAPGTVVHMLTGHAFSRALRAHFLTHTVLAKLMFVGHIPDDSIPAITSAVSSVLECNYSPREDLNSLVNNVAQIFKQLCDQASDGSRTGKLWVQYFRQVELIKDFISAERTGDWDRHLDTVISMLPHFHAAGHMAYAKCAHLYIQQMQDLPSKMSSNDHISFTKLGYFTIRRGDKFWGGNFSDQTIEQCLMRIFKVSGGMTRGRGITDSTLAKWVTALPMCAPICSALEQLTNVHTGDSEQHKDIRPSTQNRDHDDLKKLTEWLEAHHPFENRQKDRLISLSTGKIADISVTCDDAVHVGGNAIKKMVGKSFSSVKLRRSDTAKSLAAMSNTIKIHDSDVVVNPSILFNRITCVLESQEQMKDYLAYELSPEPPSLFESGIMRKSQKSVLGTMLKAEGEELKIMPDKALFVLDGGFLIRAMIWPKQCCYRDICASYLAYITKHFDTDSHIVFDGYKTGSTKIQEQVRRAKGRCSADLKVELDLPVTHCQSDFLANTSNKIQLIEILTEYLQASSIKTHQADGDADTLIVKTALDLSSNSDLNIVVVGTDTDLLVMLLAHGDQNMKLHMLTSVNPIRVHDIREIQDSLGTITTYLPVIHAISGCDTTSSFFKIGKKTALKVLRNDKCREAMQVFLRSSHKVEVSEAGEKLILLLYGAGADDTLDNFRYTAYRRSVAKTSLRSSFQLASLPPTSAAAREHSCRVYLQVQTWLFNPMEPLSWGWEERNENLQPITTCDAVAPKSLLNFISCGCKAGCSKSCSCRRAGLFCSNICKNCVGVDCTNIDRLPIIEDDSDNSD